MPDILTDVSPASMAQAVEANLFSFFQQLNRWPRVEVRDEGHCVWTMSDLPYPLFNSVLRACVDDAGADRLIELRMQSCRDRRVPMLWWTGPSTAPSDLADRLDGCGFMLEPAFGMAADLSLSPPYTEIDTDLSLSVPGGESDNVRIDRVADRATLAIWSRVLCDGFNAPHAFGGAFSEMAEAIGLDGDSSFRHYLARVNGEPAATCSLYLGAGVAGIYDVSTMPGYRRQGVGAAITRRAMDEARAAGYRMAILHASHLGLGMYRSLGFETICDIGQHVWSPED